MANVSPADVERPPSFADGLDPTSYLRPPADPEHPEDPLTAFHEAIDYLDPGAWVMAAISGLVGSNPVEDAMERLGGDWRAYGRAAGMFTNLGSFFEAVGWNVKTGNDELDGYWSGQAADAAWIHFEDLAQRCIAHKATLDHLHEQYKTAGDAAYHFAISGGPVAAAIIDAAIVAGIAAAAGTATSETLIGGAIGYGVAAYEVWEIIELCDKLLRMIGLADAAIQAVVGQIGTIVGTSPDVVAGFSGISMEHSTMPTLPGGN
ncbi:hypothetical protein AB0M46_40915 [Dactylosporangium sp. NPDC051485]|uniref:hypothetical protein n=1 Tax=Dactylosporangium sp. NPDC051485 TaxID=3154846 RepID=UPI003434E20F